MKDDKPSPASGALDRTLTEGGPNRSGDRAASAQGSIRVDDSPADALAGTVALRKPADPRERDEPQDFRELVEVSSANYVAGPEVARGGMGRIVRARDRRLGRIVALKELLEHSPDRAARFEREARITARLQHPSIVNVYEAGRWPSGQPFFAMKMVSGHSLSDALERAGTLDDRMAVLPRLIGVVEAMAYAHERGIIHRDLKPSNILLGEFGETVVIDWGLAKDLSSNERELEPGPLARGTGRADLTVAGAVMGTPAYMAPEQAEGKEVDQRSDVYSLGAILYHTLSGSPPFSGSSADEIISKVTSEAPRTIADSQPGLPHDLQTIVSKAMDRDPDRRYPSAVELADDLVRFRRGQLVAAHSYSSWELFWRWIRRHAALVAVSAAALAVAGASLAVSFTEIVEERDRAETARRQASSRADQVLVSEAHSQVERDPLRALALLAELSPEADPVHWRRARLTALAAVMAGLPTVVAHNDSLHDLEFAAGDSAIVVGEDQTAVKILPLDGSPAREIERLDNKLLDLAVSPDGDRVAASSTDSTIRLWRLSSTARQILRGHEGFVSQVRFFPDGKRLASASFDGTVRVWDLSTMESRVMNGPKAVAISLATSSDGTRVAAGVIGQGIRLWDAETGSEIAHYEFGKAPANKGELDTAIAVAFSPDGRSLAAGGPAGGAVWNLDSGTRTDLSDHDGAVYSVVFTADGRLASAGDDRAIRLWSPELERQQVLHGHSKPIVLIKLSDGGDVLASLSTDGEVRAWRITGDSATPLVTIPGGRDAAGMTLAKDGSRVAALRDRSLRVWRVGSAARQLPVEGEYSATLVSFSYDSSSVLVSDVGRKVQLAPLGPGESQVLTTAHGFRAAVALGPDRGVLTVDGRGRLELWRSQDDKTDLPGEAGWPLVVSPNRRIAAAPGHGDTLRLWDVTTGEARVLTGLGAEVGELSFSRDGRWLAAGAGKALHVWDMASGARRSFEDHGDRITHLYLGDRGNCAVTGANDGTIRRRDLRTGLVETIASELEWVSDLAGHGDCEAIAWIGGDATARLWSGDGGKTALDQGTDIGHIEFSPDGTLLAGIGQEPGVLLWDTATRASLLLGESEGEVRAIAFAPDGSHLATAGVDAVRVWPLDVPADATELRSWLQREGRRLAPR